MSFSSPDSTVRGGFDLTVDSALRGLTSIRDRGAEADTTLERLGRRLDDLGRKVSRPRVELTGLDRVNAQLSELELRLARLDRSRSTSTIGVRGGFGGGGFANNTGSVGGGGGRAFSTLGGLGGALPWWSAALPLAPTLLGGAAGLVGSAGAATLGAGTVGLGALGAGAAGAGLTLAVARPAIQAIGQITAAQKAYNQAIAEFGRNSAQAASEAAKLNAAVAANPAAAGAARQLGGFRASWASNTTAARANVYSGVSGVLYNARRATPTLGAAATAATGATASAATAFSGFLAQPAEQAMLLQLTGSFAQNLPIAERSLENIVTVFGHLAVDALPFFHEANVWVENWTTGLARSSADTPRVSSTMQGLVTQAKDWARLMGAGAHLLKDVFAPAAPAGGSMVVSLTHTLDHWDTWLRDNPQKVQGFFRNAEQGVGRIATVLANLTGDVWRLFQALNPILTRAEQFLSFASGVGGGSLLGGAGLLYGAYQGARGALGGIGPSPGAALGSFVFGRSPRLGGGGAGGAAPLLAAAGAGSGISAASRATNLEVARGRTAGGVLLMGGATEGPDAVLARRAAAAESGWLSSVRGLATMNPAMGRAADVLTTGGRAIAGAARGAAMFLAPLAAIQGIVTGAGTHGGAPQKINAGLSSALSMLTLGTVPRSTFSHVFSGAFGAAGTGISLSGDPRLQQGYNRIASQAGNVRTPQQLQAVTASVQQQLQRPGALSEMSPQEQAHITAFLNHALGTAVSNAGASASNTWENAFTMGLDRGVGPQRAVSTMLSGMRAQVTQLGPRGARAFASDTAQWASQMMADQPKLQGPLRRLMAGITSDINRANDATGKSFADLQRKVFYFNGQILQGTTQAWQAIGKSLTDPALVAQEKLSGIFGEIQKEAIDALTGMGFTGAQAKKIVSGVTSGTVNQATVQQGIAATQGLQASGISPSQSTAIATNAITTGQRPHARGGMIGGTGLLDTVPLPGGGTAAPGEAYIANRHTMNALTRATLRMYGKTAWQMINSEQRPHSFPPRGFAVGGSNTGGGGLIGGNFVPEPGTNFTYGQEPQIAAALTQLARELHVNIYGISGYRSPAHSVSVGGFANDPHTQGRAADIGVNSLMRDSAAQLSAAQLAAVGLWRPFDPSGAVGNPEVNHVQLLAGGAQGSLVGGGPTRSVLSGVTLKSPSVNLAGVPGALARGAGRAYATGLQGRLNTILSAGGGGAGSISAQGWAGGGSAAANQTLGRQMMLSAGWGADQWPPLQALWNQESGWNANIVNPSSGAMGIPQALGHGNVFRLGDAPAQIAWGLNYIRGKYGSPAAAWAHEQANNWYQTGGRVNWAGWNARGGKFSVSSPTMFGAGERGQREDVSITPAGKGGHGVNVSFHGVTFVGGDKRALESIAEQVAAKIIDALDGTEGAGDRELMGAQS